jgi:hypothetical protein
MTGDLESWVRALEARHMADLRFAEVARALRALSSSYVERRSRLRDSAVLSGAGKRAAFALFYGPLHYLLVRHIVAALGAQHGGASTLVDLGCGTGAAGSAWGGATSGPAVRVLGIDRHPWALVEARDTYRHFGLAARVRRGDISTSHWPERRASFVAAFTLNELERPEREAVVSRLLERGGRGEAVLIVEPLARFVAPWWAACRDLFVRAGGQADEWRFRVELPDLVGRLDRAAGMRHDELTGRSLWIGPGRPVA